MSQTNFRKVILATLIILIIAVVAYFFIAITATEKQPLPSNAPEQGSRPLASTTTNSSPEISLLSNKSEYTLGEEVIVDIVNHLGKDIYVPTTCGSVPYLFLQKKAGSVWKSYDPFPTKDCDRAIPFFKFISAPQQSNRFITNLTVYERGGSDPFRVSPGTYRLEMNYTTHQNPTLLGADPTFVQIFSNEFVLSR